MTTENKPTTTDAELTARLRAGDSTAAEALLARHSAMIHKQIQYLQPPRHIDYADLIQVGQIALTRAAQLWNPTGKASFSTYAWRAINNRLRRFIQAEQPHAHPQAPTTEDESSIHHIPDHRAINPDNALDAATLLAKLTPGERLIVRLKLEFETHHNQSWKQIADYTSLSTAQAKALYNAAIAKLQANQEQLSGGRAATDPV